MALTRTQYDAVMHEYEERRRKNQLLLSERYEEIYNTIPDFKELDAQIAHNSVEKGKALCVAIANKYSLT